MTKNREWISGIKQSGDRGTAWRLHALKQGFSLAASEQKFYIPYGTVLPLASIFPEGVIHDLAAARNLALGAEPERSLVQDAYPQQAGIEFDDAYLTVSIEDFEDDDDTSRQWRCIVNCSALSTERMDDLFSRLHKFAVPKLTPKKKPHIMFLTKETRTGTVRYGTTNSEIVCPELVSSNYSPKVQDAFKVAVQELTTENPTGRITIIDGPPGTGKTYFVRALCAQVSNAIFITSSMLAQLDSPELASFLLSKKFDDGMTIVIEDGDVLLQKRTDKNLALLMTILNLADGILGDALGTRVVVTTNQTIDEVDSAFLRAGRLSQRIHIGPLEPMYANSCYLGLTGKTPSPLYSKPTVLADIYAKTRSMPEKSSPTKSVVS